MSNRAIIDRAIDIVNELHHERLDYESEYVPLIDALQLLSELQEKNESGLLVELPCKVGDKVYSINKRWLTGELYIDDRFAITEIFICKTKIDLFIGIEGSDFEIEDGIPFVEGRDFFTKEAAEAKLKELRGE